MKTFSIAAGLVVLGILFWVAIVALIALPISLIVGALWNFLAPQFGMAGWDGLTSYVITLFVMVIGSMVGKS